MKVSPQKVMGAGISSLIQHMSCTPSLKRLSVAGISEDDSTKSNGCRNKQLDSTYQLHAQPEEAEA